MYLLLAPLAVFGPAHAWEVKTNSAGDPLHWVEVPVAYRINTDNGQGLSSDEVKGAVRGAFSSWEGVEGSHIRFDFGGETNISQHGHEDGVNAVFFEQNWPADWDDDLLAMALTWNIDGGEIIAMDIVVNEDHAWTTQDGQGYDLQNALTHEVGHAIGLAHTQDDLATMFGSSSMDDREKRDLAEDDEQALRFLYSGRLTGPTEFGCSSIGGAPAGLAPLFASVFGAFAFRRRRSGADEEKVSGQG